MASRCSSEQHSRRSCGRRVWRCSRSARGSVRSAQHPGCSRHQRAAGAQNNSDRRLDRISDAWLQHRAAARRRAHARHGVACDLLARRSAHVDRDCGPRLRRPANRWCARYAKPARRLDRFCFAGHVDGVAGLRLACIAACEDGTLPVVGPFVLATTAFVLLLTLESRIEAPLVDLSFFARRGFVMGVATGSLSMFSIMSLLLYFNLYAQSREGLALRRWRPAPRCCR